jgi:HK97 family phage portal protein
MAALRASPENPSTNLSNPDDWFWQWATGGGQSKAGQPVSRTTALQLAVVYACVRVLAESVASLPCILYRRLPGGGRERARGHPLYDVLRNEPNPHMSAFGYFETKQGHLALDGNAYSAIERTGGGRVKTLWNQDPTDTEVFVTPARAIGYRFGDETYNAQDVLHVPGLGWDGIVGYSVLTVAREAIGVGLGAQTEAAEFFGEGMRPDGVLTSEMTVEDDQRKDMATAWKKAHGNKRAIAILGGGLKYERVGVTPEEAQFLETRKFQVNEIARLYRIPPHMVGDLERATFSNIEHQALEFVTHTLRPWLMRWEGELNRKLLLPSERAEYKIEFLVDAMLRADLSTRFAAYSQAINANKPWMSVNQIRDLENWNPTDGGDDFTPSVNVGTNKPRAA